MSTNDESQKPDKKVKDKKTKQKANYVIFPLWLLEGANVVNIHEIAFKIFCFAVYPHAKKLGFGTLERRIASASTYYGFHLGEFDRRAYKIRDVGEILFNNLKPGYPMASIPANKLIEYINFNEDAYFEKNELEVISFLAYCSLRSIVGKELTRKTYIIVMVARMAGNYKTPNENELPDFLKKYLRRRQFDKLKWELKQNWGVKFYAKNSKGFYVSFDLEIKTFIKTIEKNRKHILLSQDRKAESEAREQALKELDNTSDEPTK